MVTPFNMCREFSKDNTKGEFRIVAEIEGALCYLGHDIILELILLDSYSDT